MRLRLIDRKEVLNASKLSVNIIKCPFYTKIIITRITTSISSEAQQMTNRQSEL